MGKGQMKKGFTIIETMLVLSISGLLTVALLVGWSVNLNRQRYDDAVNTFKSDIQDVFNEVENPTNSNTNNTCSSSGGNLDINNNPKKALGRGNTDCIIMGKLIVFSENGNIGGGSNNFATFNLVGNATNDYSQFPNSINAIRESRITVDSTSRKEYQLEWGATSRMATDNRGNNFQIFNTEGGDPNISYAGDSVHTLNAVMIVKSPLDGSILTFGAVFNGDISGFNHLQFVSQGMLLDSNNRSFNTCVANPSGNGLVFGRNKMIRIGQTASSVEIMPLDSYNCGSGSEWSDVIINGGAL